MILTQEQHDREHGGADWLTCTKLGKPRLCFSLGKDLALSMDFDYLQNRSKQLGNNRNKS